MQKNKNILQIRADILQRIRTHFQNTNALEVDTPLLCQYSVTDPYMSAMKVFNSCQQSLGYLQTSPEYAMKKLLCQFPQDIFQLNKVFRADESSPNHANEFTMLEWYRVYIDEKKLMDEVFQIISTIAGKNKRIDWSYRDAFKEILNFDPFYISFYELSALSKKILGELPDNMLFDNYLTLLFAEKIEPNFEHDAVTFIYDFPASQASLAKLDEKHYGKTARRFEAYCGGLELANGFYELTNPNEQLKRFQIDNQIRQELGYETIEIDFELISALKKGLPECSGVALGVDRLIMLKLAETDIKNVLPMAILNE